jgi:type VI secretion system protein VasD
MMTRTLRTLVLISAGVASLAGCGSSPPKPQAMKLSVAMSADVNPDTQNRPSPIVVRVYQLKDDAAFKDADFFALYDKEQATLAAALVSREEFELAPGEHHDADYKVSPDTHFIAVTAAYRDIRNAAWRAEMGAPVKKHKIAVAVERARVTVAAQ